MQKNFFAKRFLSPKERRLLHRLIGFSFLATDDETASGGRSKMALKTFGNKLISAVTE